MPHADQATVDLLTDYFAAMQAKDSEHIGSYYADDITLTFANAPTVTGRDAVLAQMTTLLAKVESLAHPLINVWQEDDGSSSSRSPASGASPTASKRRSTRVRSSPSPTGSSPTSASTSTTAPSTPTSTEGPVAGIPPSAS
jgi:ketosteroid isomerase-like protein